MTNEKRHAYLESQVLELETKLGVSLGERCPKCSRRMMRLINTDLRGEVTLETWHCEACGARRDVVVATVR